MHNIFKSQRFSGTFSKVIIFFLISGCLNFTIADWVHSGLTTSNVNALVVKDNLLFAGTLISGVCVSTNGGNSWSLCLKNQSIWELAVFGNYILAGTHQKGVFVSSDNGVNWVHSSLTNETVYSFTAYGNNILAGTTAGVYSSADYGQTWTNISNDIRNIYTFFVVGNDILAGVSFTNAKGIFRSTNNGVSWEPTSFNSAAVAYIGMIGNTIFAGTDDFTVNTNGLYSSIDNGLTWNQTALNNDIHIDAMHIKGDTMLVGTYRNGIYVSSNGGTSWAQRNEGLPYAPVPPNGLSITIYNNYIFAGIQYNGVYKRNLDELIGIQPISSEIPSEFSLSQNYPNPFNPVTNIEFAIPKETHVSLKVFDVKGSLVKVLAEENLRAGKYSIDFNAAALSSGIYFYALQAGDFRETKKMVLVK